MAKFFKTDSERQLWIKLNAERIQYSQSVINGVNEELGDINEQYSTMWVSKNQLEYDEANCDTPRFSFEELLTKTQDELLILLHNKNVEKIEKIFGAFKQINPLDNDY